MLELFNHSRIPTIAEVDVLVLGAGTAGCCAALAAAKDPTLSVAIIERYGFLGGTSTQMLDTFYGFFTPGDQPRKVAGGIPDIVVNRLDARDGIFLRPNTYGAGTGVNYNPELLKLVWDQLLIEAGVNIFMHSTLVDVVTDGSSSPVGVVISSKRGHYVIKAKRFIDASGDADFCHLGEIAYEKAGDTEPAQTLTTTFRMNAVDLDKFDQAGGKQMLMQKMDQAISDGTHPLPRKAGSAHKMCQKGCIATVAVRVAGIDATDFEQLTAAEIEGRRQAFIFETFFRECVPGYEDAHIIGLSHQIGVRETRRVYGEYRLTREDCLTVARFDHRILLCGAPIEDHRKAEGGAEETYWAYVPDGAAYDVPYGTIVPKGSEKVWVVGRCFSATHDAHASCRSMAQTMSMGQAAGFAASQSLQTDKAANQIDVSVLQDSLRRNGAVLETPETVAATAAHAWRKNITANLY